MYIFTIHIYFFLLYQSIIIITTSVSWRLGMPDSTQSGTLSAIKQFDIFIAPIHEPAFDAILQTDFTQECTAGTLCLTNDMYICEHANVYYF
jgi:hypothetical protein